MSHTDCTAEQRIVVKRARGTVVEYASAVARSGQILSFTCNAARAERISPTTADAVALYYRSRPSAGLTFEEFP